MAVFFFYQFSYYFGKSIVSGGKVYPLVICGKPNVHGVYSIYKAIIIIVEFVNGNNGNSNAVSFTIYYKMIFKEKPREIHKI